MGVDMVIVAEWCLGLVEASDRMTVKTLAQLVGIVR